MSAVKSIIKYNYDMMLLRDYLRTAIKDAGFSHATIAKTPTGTKVELYVTRPGIVIGRKGVGIRELTDTLATNFGLKSPQVAVVEITEPELYPSVMCNRMASHLERGTAFRRATMWTIKQIMEGGAMGVQITISGKLRGDRSAFEKHTAGVLPRAGHHAEVIVDEDVAHVNTPMGLIGIRIRIARKEKMIKDFEMKPAGPEGDGGAQAAKAKAKAEAGPAGQDGGAQEVGEGGGDADAQAASGEQAEAPQPQPQPPSPVQPDGADAGGPQPGQPAERGAATESGRVRTEGEEAGKTDMPDGGAGAGDGT